MLALNYEWRRIIAIALQFYFSHGQAALDNGNEDLFEALIQDLYNAETNVKTRVKPFNLNTSYTTSSTTYVLLPAAQFLHTFTLPNALIEASLLCGLSSSAKMWLRVYCGGLAGQDGGEIVVESSSQNHAILAERFSGVIGEQLIGLEWKTDGALGIHYPRRPVLFRIIEYAD